MERVQESDFIIYKEDVIHTYEYIDVIDMEGGYRIHNICSGTILKVDVFTAYIVELLHTEMSYFELQDRLMQDLSDLQINMYMVNGILEYFIDIHFISIQRKKYKIRVLLINPCYRYANNVYRDMSIVPPLGVLYIATRLFRAGYHVSILDMLLNDIRPNELDVYIQNEKPDIVGISMNFTSTANICFEIAERLKKLEIHHVFVGGNHATFTYKETIANKNIDYIVRYQGEQTVLELVDIIRTEKWSELEKCEGLVYKKNNEIFVNEKRKNADINEREIPEWHLLDIYKYKEENRRSLNTSQGCPCACAFCSTTAFNDELHFMKAENVIKLLQKIRRIEGRKTINVSFSDDAFTCHKQRVVELCNSIIAHNMDILWACSTRVDLVSEELLKLMYRAGCRAVLFGIESCSNETLQKVGKKIDIEQAEKAILLAKKVGMSVKEMFILGLPYETKETTKLIKKFVLKTNPDEVRFGMLSMYPGTPIWNEAEKYGINLLTHDWGDYDLLRPTTNNTFLEEREIYSLFELIKKYDYERNVGTIEGVATFQERKIEYTRRLFEENLDKFPYPQREEGYFEKFIPTIISSRGCNGRCSFCSTRYTGNWRGRTPENVYLEIEDIVLHHKQNHFQFVEPNFLQDGARAQRIAELLEKLPCDVTFDFACRIDSIVNHKNVITKLKKAGAIKVLLGIENFSNFILEAWKKDITCKQIEEAIKILRSNKLAFSVSLILFHPDVTIEELIFNVKEIEKLDIVYEIENLYNALILIPGTKMNVTNQKKEWKYKEKQICHIHKACLEYKEQLDKYCKDFSLSMIDYKTLFELNAFLKWYELDRLKELLGLPVQSKKIEKESVFILNSRIGIQMEGKTGRCINEETGVVFQVDNILIEVLNYINNRNVFWIIEDIKKIGGEYKLEKSKIVERICFLLKNRFILIGGK